ncbi:MAG: N-acyl-D-amino-acid deacylase family protein [Minisyncoccia bacterium]
MYDILIKNGEIIDGSGNPSKKMDIAISNKKIVGLGYFKNEKAKKEINAETKLVVPGFIEVNTNSDHDLTLWHNRGENMLLQGVTTLIGGKSGVSLAPFIKPNLNCLNRFGKVDININWSTLSEFFVFLRKQKLYLNFATLIGWGILRASLVNNEFRSLTEEELSKLLLVVKKSLEQGAFGVSFGLGYDVEQAVGIKEIKAVAEIVSKYQGILSFSLRDYSDRLITSLEEALTVLKYFKIPIQIELLKAEGKENEKLFQEALDLIEKMNQDNLITFEIIPYETELISLTDLLPDWVIVEGREALLRYLNNNETKEYLINEIKKKKYLYENLKIINSGNNWWFNNKNLKEIANNFSLSIEETILKLIKMTSEKIYAISKTQNIENIIMGVLNKNSFITSHSGLYDLNKTSSRRNWLHPKTCGTFSKFINEFIIKEKKISWEEGIRKLTGKVSDYLKLKNRGYLKEDYYADLLVINPLKLKDNAILDNPFQYSEGIELIVINGKIVYERGIFESESHGEIILK